MSKIFFQFIADKTIVEVEQFSGLNLLGHAQIAEISLQSRCGGQSACGTCRVNPKKGKLSPVLPDERELLAKLGLDSSQVRLACRAFPENSENEDILVEVPSDRFKDARFTR